MLLSYTKTRDNKVVQKYLLPRVLLHGQSDIDEAEDRRFFVEAVNKSIHDAILNHNKVFLNAFHNTMKEVFHGYLIDQVGLRGLIKPVLDIKKQHQLVMMMSRQFRAHLSKFRVLLLIRCSIILDRQCSMCNSRVRQGQN